MYSANISCYLRMPPSIAEPDLIYAYFSISRLKYDYSVICGGIGLVAAGNGIVRYFDLPFICMHIYLLGTS
jgi:hypothetical protein